MEDDDLNVRYCIKCGKELVEGESQYCTEHIPVNKGERTRQTWRARAANASRSVSLDEELAIARTVLGTRLDICDTDEMLLLADTSILRNVETIKALAESKTRIDEKRDLVVDAKKLVMFADEIVKIATKLLPPERLEVFKTDLIAAYSRITTGEKHVETDETAH